MEKNNKEKPTFACAKQLRGLKLDEYLEKCVISMHRSCAEAGEVYKFNQARLSRFAQVSRETVRSHQKYINSVLEKLQANRRTASGSVQVDNYLEKIERLQAELISSRSQYDALRGLYVDLFWLLHVQSVDVSNMVLQRMNSAYQQECVCPLCHSTKNDGPHSAGD